MTADALLIDFGGVLTTSIFGSFDAFCAQRGLAAGAVARCLSDDPEGAGLLVALEKGEIDDAAFEAGFAERLTAATGAPIAAEGLLAALTERLEPVPEMIDAVRALRCRGVPTVMVSNAMGHASYDLIGLDGLFDHVILSTDLGVRKPSRRMYAEAAARVGVAPGRCLMVDDLEQNLVGAARIGMPGHLHVDAPGTLARLRAAFG